MSSDIVWISRRVRREDENTTTQQEHHGFFFVFSEYRIFSSIRILPYEMWKGSCVFENERSAVEKIEWIMELEDKSIFKIIIAVMK